MAITAAFLHRCIVRGILGGFIYGAVAAYFDQKTPLLSPLFRILASYLAQLVSSYKGHPISAGLVLGPEMTNVGAIITHLIDSIASIAKSSNP